MRDCSLKVAMDAIAECEYLKILYVSKEGVNLMLFFFIYMYICNKPYTNQKKKYLHTSPSEKTLSPFLKTGET